MNLFLWKINLLFTFFKEFKPASILFFVCNDQFLFFIYFDSIYYSDFLLLSKWVSNSDILLLELHDVTNKLLPEIS